MFLYRRERRAKELLAWFTLKTANDRLLRNLEGTLTLLQSFSDSPPETKVARRDASYDLSEMETRLTRNLEGLPARWIAEHLPYRDASGVVWANDIQAVTGGIRDLVDAIAAMRRDLDKELMGKGDLGRRAEPWVPRATGVSAIIKRQLALVPSEALALEDD